MTVDPRAASMTEAQLMESIRAMVRDLGLLAYHAHDARRSWGPGFPDLVIVGRGGIIWRECKTESGSLSPEQRQWADALQAAGQRWSVWRPRHLLSGQVARELAGVAALQLGLFDGEAAS
jgi:hypothetical protein